MIVAIMRHGEAEHNTERVFDSNILSTKSLTTKGIPDTFLTGKWLVSQMKKRNFVINGIYVSPLLRTYQTAMNVRSILVKDNVKYRDGKIILDFSLRESDMGTFDGRDVDSYPYPAWDFTKNNKFGGETEIDVMRRIHKFISHINLNENILIVTHGTPMKCLLQYFLPNEESFKDIRPDKAECIIIDTGNNTFSSSKVS